MTSKEMNQQEYYDWHDTTGRLLISVIAWIEMTGKNKLTDELKEELELAQKLQKMLYERHDSTLIDRDIPEIGGEQW